jgi:hypothetical protein
VPSERWLLDMARDTWEYAISKFQKTDQVGQDNFPWLPAGAIALNLALLTGLRDRWQHSVDIYTSMFDLEMVPTGQKNWDQGGGFDWVVEVRHGPTAVSQPSVRVTLEGSRRGIRWDKRPGQETVAADIYEPSSAMAVVESFLYKVAKPHGQEDPASPP